MRYCALMDSRCALFGRRLFHRQAFQQEVAFSRPTDAGSPPCVSQLEDFWIIRDEGMIVLDQKAGQASFAHSVLSTKDMLRGPCRAYRNRAVLWRSRGKFAGVSRFNCEREQWGLMFCRSII